MKILIGTLILASLCSAGDVTITAGTSIYIDKMSNDLDGYIQAEMVKQHVPLRVVLSPDKADFVMTGASTENSQWKWHEGWLTPEQDHASGNVMGCRSAREGSDMGVRSR